MQHSSATTGDQSMAQHSTAMHSTGEQGVGTLTHDSLLQTAALGGSRYDC